ncbi:Asp-tRNA(Asn)/Glu-tRNA(Gln) amidotransferase subunit GatC [Lapidilactobacillus achengensis]|uniref:Aspartyl/glutamyl-tRNA(Asn/Gln) amidotransferase subunit C n=1 Tax=Lapidilactobacillus achengensis TaxID=2486000 RepID=A0ABW1ULQ8_9LACO|nr:Asp-tRNA(Asn)/Glu-tRNA(Gln) amidotransferase subunit GatC [Lapidilactobacillus achengensis]
MISKDQVAHVAKLARLSFSEAELEQFTHQLDQIIAMENELAEVPTDGVTPTTQVSDERNVFRADVPVTGGPTRDQLLQNVPESKDGLIKVPTIIDKGEADA